MILSLFILKRFIKDHTKVKFSYLQGESYFFHTLIRRLSITYEYS